MRESFNGWNQIERKLQGRGPQMNSLARKIAMLKLFRPNKNRWSNLYTVFMINAMFCIDWRTWATLMSTKKMIKI